MDGNGWESVLRLSVLACALVATTAHARGVSPYLPVNLAPEIERQIERVLILAGQPMLKRPIAAATVLDALPAASERDAALCADVRRYLTSLARTAGISYASFTAAGTSGRISVTGRGSLCWCHISFWAIVPSP